MTKKEPNGFSLIELLLVVAIILIIAAMAIPNLLRARTSANEASAVSSIHAVNTGEITYSMLFPDIGYSATLANLGPGACDIPAAACIIDGALAGGTKSGYVFKYVQVVGGGPPASGYTLNADPDRAGGNRPA